jgi:hypothetical protein
LCGSGAYADILLEMRWFARPTDPDRRRVIEAFSRYDATPKRLVIERTLDGADYISHGDLPEHDLDTGRQIIKEILASTGPLDPTDTSLQTPLGSTLVYIMTA